MRVAARLSIIASGLIACGANAQDEDLSRAATPVDIVDWAQKIQRNYPAIALRHMEEGTVTMRITIEASGRVSDCQITRSSQSIALDQAACDGMMNFARYEPATNKEGEPIASVASQSVRYVLPKTALHFRHPAPIDEARWRKTVFDAAFNEALGKAESKQVVFQLVIDEGGDPSGCGMAMSSGNADLDRRGCAGLLEHARFKPATLLDGTTIPGSYWVGHSPD